ncbi:MAG TPA: large conductance mechanosensitive channel protein MscL [Chthoniobacteraceae bacterium]|nr:large conductance mechanosensitive channel protein MscL [Chthoniobacteraceae bacterium]
MSIVTTIHAKSVGLVNEFKTFIAKGNVMDLAVGVIIGAAFGDIVKAMVSDIITPLFTLFKGATAGKMTEFADYKLGPFLVGHFINAIFSFLILAAVVFFLLVKPMNKLMLSLQKPKGPDVPPPTPEDVQLLREIRDLLKTQKPPSQPAGEMVRPPIP